MSSRRIGNYQITDYIGSGGFGSVFKAEDVTSQGRIVAIKELHKKHTRNSVIKQRFFQEAVAMARLDHPNLPRLFTFGEDNGSYYLVMEFISGKLLSDELQDGQVEAPERAAAIMIQALGAVAYAHKNGIIHRDLKPDNIMLVDGGSSVKVKVLDFGIARMVGGENLTLAGEGFGTPAYMSPERIKGASGNDPRIDIYSAGIILYEMLTGKTPFSSSASDPSIYWSEMSRLHENEPLPPLGPLGVPAQLEAVIRRATAKRPDDRYPSAEDMLADLERVAGTTQQVVSQVGTARLSLTTQPPAADVFVDDVFKGASEASRGRILIDALTAGLHTVKVTKDGYNEYRISVSLEDGRQTDLQVALAARATIAMPVVQETAAAGFETLKFQASDDAKTALLVIESLPAGSQVFVGSQAVALAGEDGRATMKLAPGAHEISVATPTGGTGKKLITLSQVDTGSMKTMTVPVGSGTPTVPTGRPKAIASSPAGKGKRIAAAVATILFLALGGTAFYVLSGAGRKPATPSTEAASPSPSTAQSSAAPPPISEAAAQSPPPEAPGQKPDPGNSAQTAAEKEKKVEQDLKKAEKALADVEEKKKQLQKSATEAQQPATPPPAAQLPPPRTETETQVGPTAGFGCVVVTVTDRNGLPVPQVHVVLAELDNSSTRSGRTNAAGRWRQCGLPTGHSVRASVLGPRGGLWGSRVVSVTQGLTLADIQVERSIEDQPMGPKRRGPYDRRYP
jgi:serine/threonine protein kinase